MKIVIFQVFMLITCLLSTPALSQQFGNLVNMGQIESNEIVEVSGIVATSKNPGVLWTHNDSGSRPGNNSVFGFAQELISDPHFQAGLIVKKPTNPPVEIDGIIQFDTTQTALWDCAQWWSKSSLFDIDPIDMQNGWKHWENSEKKVLMGPHGTENFDILLGVNSYNEYGGVYRQNGQQWPHLLVEQRLSPPNTAGPGSPSLDNHVKLDFHVEAKLENDSTIIEEGYDPNLHAGQFLIYFTVQNLNPNSSGYGKDYIWLGVQIYDDRKERPAEYINHDDGTQTLIYSLAYDSVAVKSTHSNEWVEFNVDLYSYALKALAEAWGRGYLSASQDLADYKIGGMNMGWELPGMFIGDMKIRNLSLTASEVTTVENDKFVGETGFSLSLNYPNPFNPSTIISYQLPESDKVELTVFNISGQHITTLVNKEQTSGNYRVQWDGRDDKGVIVSSGVYIYRLKAGSFIKTRKMMLLR